jgi:hypothetical protein
MKFEFTGSDASNYKILLDGNPITYCQSVDFHIDVNRQIPVVNLNIVPVGGNGIVVDNAEGYITIGDKTYKLTEVVIEQEDTTESAEDKGEQ